MDMNYAKPESRLALVARVLLGLLLIGSVVVRVFSSSGQDGFDPRAAEWLSAMAATGYLLPLLLLTEFSVGVALLIGRFVPLALIVFAPINLNIFLLHALLDPHPARLAQIAFMGAAHLYLAWHFRAAFKPILTADRDPTLLTLARQRHAPLLPLLRTLLGGLFVVTGLSKLLGFASTAAPLLAAMLATGYLYTVLGSLELAAGLMLIVGRRVLLALVMLAPLVVNIAAYHLFLDRTSPLAFVAVAAGVILGVLAWDERRRFARLFLGRGSGLEVQPPQ